jgi:hypothetical protein
MSRRAAKFATIARPVLEQIRSSAWARNRESSKIHQAQRLLALLPSSSLRGASDQSEQGLKQLLEWASHYCDRERVAITRWLGIAVQ